MADHVRKRIRDNIVTTLTGMATTGSNVFASRIRPVAEGVLPCLLIYATEEDISEDATTLLALERALIVRVSGIVQANTSLDDTLDTIAAEVEVALNIDPSRNNLAFGTDLTSTVIELDGESEKQTGIINLDYLVRYSTLIGQPSVVA